MPKKLYNPNQTMRLDAVRRLHVVKMQRRAELAESIRKEYERQLIECEVAESRAANEAVFAGVTKKDVAQALGVGNWHTFKEILAMTVLDIEVSIKPVTWHPESRTVTIADFMYGKESVRGGTYAFTDGPYGGIEYHGLPLGLWMMDKADKAGDDMTDIDAINILTRGWLRQAKEQGAK